MVPRPDDLTRDSRRLGTGGETLAATTLRRGIGVIEGELEIDAVTHVIDTRAIDPRQALRIDEHLQAIDIEHAVIRPLCLRQFAPIAPARTTGALDAKTQAHRVSTVPEIGRAHL